MFKFGELKDKKIAQKIQNDLVKKSVNTEIKFNFESDLHELYVKQESDFELAHNYFRVTLGFPAQHQPDPEWEKISSIKLGSITRFFIITCVLSYVFINFFKNYEILNWLFISDNKENLDLVTKEFEIWRLITPAFLHFSILHILFNLLWLKTLGSVYERTIGVKSYLLIFLVATISSNVLQFYVTGFRFGGMSGFVYALFGFLWMHKKFNQNYNFGLPNKDIYLMIGWFFLCFTGAVGNIANTAHAIGLGVGMCFGIFPINQDQTLKATGWIVLALILSLGTFLIEYFQVFSS